MYITKYNMKKVIQKEKIKIYEHFLHQLNLYSTVVLNEDKIKEALEIINNWSYTHRQDSISEVERELLIDKYLQKMKEFI